MKTIILAAGEGTRLRPYTLDRPKCMVEVEGKSLIERQLEVLRAAHSEPIILIGGYRSEMLVRPGITLKLNPRYAETNMVWTLFCAEEDFEGGFILAYGDIVYSPAVLKALMVSDADISTTIDLDWEEYWRARNEDPLEDAETLKLSSDGAILEIGQKPKSISEIEGQYMGLIKFSPKGVEILKKVFHNAKNAGSVRGKQPEKAYMTDLLQNIVDLGYRIQAVPVHGGWVEVDTVEDLESKTLTDRLSKMNN
jgi:choline kinase